MDHVFDHISIILWCCSNAKREGTLWFERILGKLILSKKVQYNRKWRESLRNLLVSNCQIHIELQAVGDIVIFIQNYLSYVILSLFFPSGFLFEPVWYAKHIGINYFFITNSYFSVINFLYPKNSDILFTANHDLLIKMLYWRAFVHLQKKGVTSRTVYLAQTVFLKIRNYCCLSHTAELEY